jgi:hypothetical protein
MKSHNLRVRKKYRVVKGRAATFFTMPEEGATFRPIYVCCQDEKAFPVAFRKASD